MPDKAVFEKYILIFYWSFSHLYIGHLQSFKQIIVTNASSNSKNELLYKRSKW